LFDATFTDVLVNVHNMEYATLFCQNFIDSVGQKGNPCQINEPYLFYFYVVCNNKLICKNSRLPVF